MSWGRKERRSAAMALDERPRQRKVLFMHAFLAGFTALQILYLALDDLKFNILLSLGFAAGYVYAFNLQPRWRGLTTYGVSALALAAALNWAQKWYQDMSLYGNVLGELAGVLIVLLSFQAFTTNAHRFMLMFSVVFLVFGAVASYDLKFMLLLPLFLIFSGCALYVANQVDVQARAADATAGDSASGAGLTRQFIVVLLRALGIVLGLSILAYLMAPHSTASPRGLLLSRIAPVEEPVDEQTETEQSPQESTEVGIGDEFDLTDPRELNSTPEPVLKVKMPRRQTYLRAQVYDLFSGRGWEKSPLLEPRSQFSGELLTLVGMTDLYASSGAGRVFNVPLVDFPSDVALRQLDRTLKVSVADGNVFSKDSKQDLQFEINQQTITLLEDQPPFYFASFQPYRLQHISPKRDNQPFDTPLMDRAAIVRPFDLSRRHPKGFTYTVQSLEPRVTAKQLDEVYGTAPQPILDHYTWLPLESEDWQSQSSARGLDPAKVRPVSQRLVNFARTRFGGPEMQNGKEVFPSVYDKARRIEDWLVRSGEFNYVRQSEPLPPEMEVTEGFCFQTQSGYCRHFASAMAVLARLNGIPSRVVSGYAPGLYSIADNAYIYRAANAHAWVELYFDGYGWIQFDPTPTGTGTVSGPESNQWLGNFLDFLQDLFVIDPARVQRTILEALRLLWEAARANARVVGLVGGLVLCFGLGLWFLLRLRSRRPRPRARLQPDNEIVALYQRLLAALQRLGFVLDPGDTARQIQHAVVRQFPALHGAMAQIVPVYERAAFALALPDPAEQEQARLGLAAIESFVAQELEERRKAQSRR